MPLLLLDRDGVINEERPDYVTRWEQFRFLPGAIDALAACRKLGFRLAIITNQSAVGRGLLSPDGLDSIHNLMLAECAARGVEIDLVLACTHAAGAGCDCRKPRPGLIARALAALGERPRDSLYIGDGHEDLGAARAASVPFVLVRTGRGEETLRHPWCRSHPPLLVVDGLREAARALAGRLEGARAA
ncbi:MAG: HAD-IIIA family hydrolase [Chloroflexi bacterium]|nr:HAD-IIIA family hydrolase [Chloroflexota bacterium]